MHGFHHFARALSRWSGHPAAFIGAVTLVVGWAVAGPILGYSEGWQLVINTATTVLTFLMVFLIQNTQNRDTEAMHIKLDELIRATKGARNELADLEEADDETLEKMHQKYLALARHAHERLSGGRPSGRRGRRTRARPARHRP
jgi:low affinity Fe/Cu permease